MAAGGTRRYHFLCIATATRNNFDRKKLPCWKANKLKQLFNICTIFNSFGSFMKIILILKLFLNPDDHQNFTFVMECHLMAMNGAYKKLIHYCPNRLLAIKQLGKK